MKNAYTIGVIIAALALVYSLTPSGKSVTINSKNWICSGSDTFGIEARCIQYTFVPNKVAAK